MLDEITSHRDIAFDDEILTSLLMQFVQFVKTAASSCIDGTRVINDATLAKGITRGMTVKSSGANHIDIAAAAVARTMGCCCCCFC
jgi:hypothetical protein